jgi:lipopolysaccharide transport system ATP-binding protein
MVVSGRVLGPSRPEPRSRAGRGRGVSLTGSGAGKSTLLKILSRSRPKAGCESAGAWPVNWKFNTGFHPKLTGRENVLLNCAILGMNRAENSAEVR